MASRRGSSKHEGPEKDPNQLDWIDWIDSKAAKVVAVLADIASLSKSVAPVVLLALLGLWSQTNPGNPLREVLGTGTIIVLVSSCIAWGTHVVRAHIARKDIAIAFHAVSLLLSIVAVVLVIDANFKVDSNHAAKATQDQQLQKEAEAKQQAAREEEERRARLAEAECLKRRDYAMEKARKVQKSAIKALDNCKAEFEKQLFTQRSVGEYCKAHQDVLNNAKESTNAAIKGVCSTGSLKKPQ